MTENDDVADGDADANDNPLSASIDALKSVKRFATAADQKRARDSLFTDAAANRKTAIKSQIRSAQRLLTRPSMPAPIKSRKEAEVRILQTRLRRVAAQTESRQISSAIRANTILRETQTVTTRESAHQTLADAQPRKSLSPAASALTRRRSVRV